MSPSVSYKSKKKERCINARMNHFDFFLPYLRDLIYVLLWFSNQLSHWVFIIILWVKGEKKRELICIWVPVCSRHCAIHVFVGFSPPQNWFNVQPYETCFVDEGSLTQRLSNSLKSLELKRYKESVCSSYYIGHVVSHMCQVFS